MIKAPFLLKPYGLAWRAARPFLRRHKRLKAGFKTRLVGPDWPEDLLPAICPVDTVHPPFRLWLHAASGGEAYLAWSIAEGLAERLGKLAVICTSMTEQGIEVLGKMQQALSSDDCFIAVSYFPLDEPGLMKRALEQAFGPPAQAPRAVALLETEIWPGLLSACREYGVRSYILNGRMTPGSLKSYRHIAGTLRRLAPNDIMATTAEDAARFKEVFDTPGGPSRVSVMPNIKFDRLVPGSEPGPGPLRQLLGQEPPQVVLLASVREEEEEELGGLIGVLRQKRPQACIVVAPRHMHRVEAWRGRLTGLGPLKLRSQGLKSLGPGEIVLWDSFGELTALYAIADVAFVGGSLAPLGGQNFLEPLAYGILPVIGPFWDNFYWAGREIFDLGLVRQAPNAAGLGEELLRQLKNPPDKKQIKSSFAGYLKTRRGGTKAAVDFLVKELWRD